jgi:hypothetical protein
LSQQKLSLTNLYNHQLTSYALFTQRAVGDQPGTLRPRYLTEWRHLPEGVFIPEFKYDSRPASLLNTNDLLRSLPVTNTAYYYKQMSNTIPYRYLAFNAQGQLVTAQGLLLTPEITVPATATRKARKRLSWKRRLMASKLWCV